MEDGKITLSKRSIAIFDNCMSELDVWHFKAINSVLLVEQLAFCKESYLGEYVLGEGLEKIDDMEGYAIAAICNKQKMDSVSKEIAEKVSETVSQEDIEDEIQEEEITEEHETSIKFKDEEGEIHTYAVEDDFIDILDKMIEFCTEKGVTVFEPVHILAAMFAAEDQELKSLFEDMELSFKKAKEFFTSEKAFRIGIVPYALSGFMSCLNDKVNVEKPCEILMRDKEVEQIWNISLKKNKRNTIIVGEAGVGKSALVEKMTYEIVKGTCPERFKDFNVISLDVNSLIAGTTFRGQAEERIKDLINFLEKNNNVILFIDEVHTILGAGSCFEGEMDLANALKPILARGDTIVIGATTDREYEAYFARDAALTRRFEKVVVEEPVVKEVYPMIRNKVNSLSEFHGVKISKKMVDFTIMIANCFAFEKKNPDKTLDLIDRSMVAAARKGKKKVNKDSILENFGIYFDLYEGMGEEARRETAYHEVGHYIVGKASGKLINFNWLAISILPADEYLGVTCYEYRKDRIPFKNRAFYIDLIAFYLGGKAAEKLAKDDFSSGAGQDLDNATKLAFNVITKYGMSIKEDERSNIFLNTPDYPMFSEKSTNMINEEVKRLVDMAYDRAKAIINENKELLESIVSDLLQKRIMSEKELDVIWQKYMNKKA